MATTIKLNGVTLPVNYSIKDALTDIVIISGTASTTPISVTLADGEYILCLTDPLTNDIIVYHPFQALDGCCEQYYVNYNIIQPTAIGGLGEIQLTAIGGDGIVSGAIQPPYTILFEPNAGTPTTSVITTFPYIISNVPEGAFTLSVKDKFNCPFIIEGVVTAPPCLLSMTSEIVGTDLNITLTGGNPQYNYTISNNTTVVLSDVFTTANYTIDISTLANDSYTLTVMDADGCESTYNFEIPSCTMIVNAVVHGRNNIELLVNITNGVADYLVEIKDINNQAIVFSNTTSLNTGIIDIAAIPVGNYILCVTDSQGCVAQYNFDICRISLFYQILNDGDLLSVTMSQNSSVPNNATPFTWELYDASNLLLDNGISNLDVFVVDISSYPVGNYYLGVTDVFGCNILVVVEKLCIMSVTAEISNTVNTDLDVIITNGSPIYTYIVNDANNVTVLSGTTTQDVFTLNLAGQPIGEYTLFVTDDEVCNANDSFELCDTVDAVLVLDRSGSLSTPTCIDISTVTILNPPDFIKTLSSGWDFSTNVVDVGDLSTDSTYLMQINNVTSEENIAVNLSTTSSWTVTAFPVFNTLNNALPIVIKYYAQSDYSGGVCMDSIKSSSISFVNALDIDTSANSAALVTFNENANLEAALGSSNATLVSSINSLNASGATNILSAIQIAYNELLLGSNNGKVIILFTDGAPNVSPNDPLTPPLTYEQEIINYVDTVIRGNVGTTGVINIYTIGLNYPNSSFLTAITNNGANIASSNNYFAIENASELENTLLNLINNLCG